MSTDISDLFSQLSIVDEDSELVASLYKITEKSPKLVRSTEYEAPAEPSIHVRSWKMNEFKYYDIPSPFPTLARGLFTQEIPGHTAGEEKFKSLGVSFYRGAEVLVIVFEIKNVKTAFFENLDALHKAFVVAAGPDYAATPVVLMGSKADEASEEEKAEARQRAKEWGERHNNASYFEVSAKEDTGLQEAFTEVARLGVKNPQH